MTTDSFDVRDATSAEMLGDFGAGERARLVTATVRRDFAYGLFRDYPADQGTGRGPGLFLASVRLPGPGAELSTQPWHLYPSGYRLETPAPFRQAVWAGRHLVLVEPNGLQAYTLP
jgi:hypothetical protein